MKKFILVLMMLFVNNSNARSINCRRHKIYCKIKKLQPLISHKKAMYLSNILYKQSKVYNGDPLLAVAIGMQETGLKDIDRKQKIIRFITECELDEGQEKCRKTWHIVEGSSDICMFQFHVATIVNYNIDPIRLKDDLNYCVKWHFKLINEKKRICKKLGKEAWSCYHSRSKNLRELYVKLVGKYL